MSVIRKTDELRAEMRRWSYATPDDFDEIFDHFTEEEEPESDQGEVAGIVDRIRQGRKRLGIMAGIVFGDDWPDLDRLSKLVGAKPEITPVVTVRSIYDKEGYYEESVIRRWLEDHEFDGLINLDNDNCGCGLDDFCCGDGCPYADCKPAYRHSDGLMYETPEEDSE